MSDHYNQDSAGSREPISHLEGSLYLDEWTSHALEEAIAAHPQPAVLILPLGSVEPHGPHLPLNTDRLLAVENAERAARALRDQGVATWVAPSLPYAVTEYAQGFCGAISLDRSLYEQLLANLSRQYQRAGFGLICWVNHHLEPEQLAAIHASARAVNDADDPTRVIAPSVVSKRWGRVLGDEFRSGACHAGTYEGSMILASRPDLVRSEIAANLPALEISLSEAIRAGKRGFLDAGMTQAYTGAPALATSEEGERLYLEHTQMVVTEVIETLEVLTRHQEEDTQV